MVAGFCGNTEVLKAVFEHEVGTIYHPPSTTHHPSTHHTAMPPPSPPPLHHRQSSVGLDKEATDEAGATILWTAAAGGKAEAVALCLEKGCSKGTHRFTSTTHRPPRTIR